MNDEHVFCLPTPPTAPAMIKGVGRLSSGGLPGPGLAVGPTIIGVVSLATAVVGLSGTYGSLVRVEIVDVCLDPGAEGTLVELVV